MSFSKKEVALDEAAEVYYDQRKCDEVLSEFQSLLDKIKKTMISSLENIMIFDFGKSLLYN